MKNKVNFEMNSSRSTFGTVSKKLYKGLSAEGVEPQRAEAFVVNGLSLYRVTYQAASPTQGQKTPIRQPTIKSVLYRGILLNDGNGLSACYPPSAKTNTIRKLQVIELVRELSLFLLRGGDKLAFLAFVLPFLRLLNITV